MIRDFANGQAVVSIISTNRADNVQKMQQLIGEQVVWVTKESDREAYLAAGATHVVTGGDLCESRNRGIDLAHDRGVTAIQLSDDLSRIDRALTKSMTISVTFDEAVDLILETLQQTGLKLAGVSPTANAFYTDTEKPVKFAHFIVGDFIAVAPGTNLRFDARMKLKEDYDYTLQHLHEYGGVARIDVLLPKFAHRTNAGGAVDFRTAEREQEAIAFLRSKWGEEIRDNPRRPNEILMKWCKFLHEPRF